MTWLTDLVFPNEIISEIASNVKTAAWVLYLQANDPFPSRRWEKDAPGEIIKASQTWNDGEPIEKTQIPADNQYCLKENLSR